MRSLAIFTVLMLALPAHAKRVVKTTETKTDKSKIEQSFDAVATGLGGLFGGSAGAKRTSSKSETTHKETRTEERVRVNGRDVDGDGDPEPAPVRRGSRGDASFGATCNANRDCASNSCFVGRGDLGYCTKMCESWSDCPSHWECKRAANAPQRICMQGD